MRQETLMERCLRENADRPDACWIWPGRPATGGYGQTGASARGHVTMFRAHRAVYERLVGRIPHGMVLDHLCRVRMCVNPRHLEPVTLRINNLRGVSAPANNARKLFCSRGHRYTPENTLIDRDGWRRCLQCERKARHVRQRRYIERKFGRPVGVHNREKTHCKNGHEFSAENMVIRTNGQRGCKACMRQRSAERRRRARAARVHVPPA